MKKFILSLVFALSAGLLFQSYVQAQVFIEYPEYNVDIAVNEDTSLDITETAIYELTSDEAHGLRRDITLNDPLRDSRCRQVQDLYCGGFDRIELVSVHDLEGNDITDRINLYKVEDEGSAKESFRIEWEIWPNGKAVNKFRTGWVIKYKIYGSILNLTEGDYFYWNLLPGERGGRVKKTQINIAFPQDHALDIDEFEMYGDFFYDYRLARNQIEIAIENLPAFGDITASYRFEKGILLLPGNLNFEILPPMGVQIEMDGYIQNDNLQNNVLKSVSAGDHQITFSHIGYKTQTINVNVESGKTTTLNFILEQEPWMTVLLLGNTLIFVCGLCLIPLAIFLYFRHYQRKGKDKDMPKTIIPLFHPPENVKPYLLGSLKDESVDKEDIVGSIIDLAYRGYLKIEDLSPNKKNNKDYKLIKVEEADESKLDPIEKDLMDALFGSKSEVKTSGLKGKFINDYIKLQNTIYSEMVTRDYFSRSPRQTIGIYVGLGIVLAMLGIFSGCLLSSLLIAVTGYFTIFTPSIALVVLGIAVLISSRFMPAKTPHGSKVYAEILGFKMYMHTAERYRVQKLKPEEFVKYLSYAIVFGIEKQWADNFKDIYKGVPDWYIGSTAGFYDAYWISSFARNFSNSTVQNIAPISNTSSGSGWSGSGSFGGFSGGGGGGGSSGAW